MDKDSLIFGPSSVERLRASLNSFINTLDAEERIAFSVLVDRIKSPLDHLKNLPEENILDPADIDTYRNLVETKHLITSKSCHKDLVIIMKATRLCNLRCVYCHSWRSGPNQMMPFGTLARTIRDVQLSNGVKNVIYVWHGGETTLVTIGYYQKALWLQEQFRQTGQVIENIIQTNGTRLNEEWIEFLKQNKFGIGISLDGPPEINDKRRVDKKGRPSTAKVVESIAKLNKAKMKYGVLVVVDDEILSLGPERMLEYLVEIGVPGAGFLNAVPENVFDQGVKGDYLPYNNYIYYMRGMFKIWWRKYKDQLIVRELVELVDAVKKNKQPISCYYRGNCMGKYLTVEPNGDLLACEKYIGDPDFLYGNLFEHNGIAEVLESSETFKKAWQITEDSSRNMECCPWFKSVCQGSCPHDRRLSSIFNEKYDNKCCGLKPLLDDIQVTLSIN
jgi:uncharacterized protein